MPKETSFFTWEMEGKLAKLFVDCRKKPLQELATSVLFSAAETSNTK